MASSNRVTVPLSPMLRFALAIASATLPLAAFADQVLATRDLQPNGRQVQEIRFGEEPGSRNLRVLVLTNGPTAGTTTVLTAVASTAAWTDPSVPPPTFTTIIPSAAAFSIGGGCRRGNQVDFPYIENFRPKILRFTNGVLSTVNVLPFDSDQYDSAECAASLDGSRTFFIYSNRNVNRLAIMVDRGGATDLNVPLVAFSSVKPPTLGGLRPAISTVPDKPFSIALMFMETNGQTRWREYDTDLLNVDRTCLVGTQAPPPSGFSIPRGARIVNNFVFGDFDGNGQFEFAALDNTRGTCAAAPAYTAAGPVAGVGYTWSEPAATILSSGRRVMFISTQALSVAPTFAPVVAPGPNPGNGGPNAACGATSTESDDLYLIGSSASAINLRIQLMLLQAPLPLPGEDELFESSLEEVSFQPALTCGLKLFL